MAPREGGSPPSMPIWRALLGSLVLLMLGPFPPALSPAATTTTLTFPAKADTYASSRQINRNFGLSTSLRTDGAPDVRTFIRFDPGGLGAPIFGTLRVFANSANSIGIDVRRVATASAWGEASLTYRSRPRVLSVVGSSGPIRAGTWVDWDVTSLLSANSRVTFALTSASSTATRLASRESLSPPHLVVVSAASPNAPPPVSGRSAPLPPPRSNTRGDFVVMGAGDIACEPPILPTASSCHQLFTSDLVATADLVLTLGDIQYEDATLDKFLLSYDLSWGRFKQKTRPVPGNHEYKTAGGAGYFDYFGPLAGERGKGYYSYDAGGWHFVALNSECADVGGCGPGSPQYEWLRADLAASAAACTAAYWHHPRFSAGKYHDDPSYQPFWELLYADGAEIVLNGHDHNYQRYAPMAPSGVRDDSTGIREFVVGTGGKNHYGLRSSATNLEVGEDSTFGVIKLTLRPQEYDWAFVPEAAAAFTDAGSGACH